MGLLGVYQESPKITRNKIKQFKNWGHNGPMVLQFTQRTAIGTKCNLKGAIHVSHYLVYF